MQKKDSADGSTDAAAATKDSGHATTSHSTSTTATTTTTTPIMPPTTHLLSRIQKSPAGKATKATKARRAPTLKATQPPFGETSFADGASYSYASGAKYGLVFGEFEFHDLVKTCKTFPRRTTQWKKPKLTLHASYGKKPYKFAGGNPWMGLIQNAPPAVKTLARIFAAYIDTDLPDYKFTDDTDLHINYYQDGKAGLAQHKDAGLGPHDIVVSITITHNPDPNGSTARELRISRDQHGKEIVARCLLGSNTIFCMKGPQFQTHFFHGIPKSSAKAQENLQRINATVRLSPRLPPRARRNAVHTPPPPTPTPPHP